MQMTFLYLCFLQKLGLKSFEWSHLLQFPKYCKNRTINSRPCLIPTNPKKYHYSLKILLHYEKTCPGKYVHRVKLEKPAERQNLLTELCTNVLHFKYERQEVSSSNIHVNAQMF